MSLIKMNPINVALSPVDYLGGTVPVPVHHDYVAITQAYVAGSKKFFLTSFEVEPTVSNSGNYVAVEGTGFLIIEEVGPMQTKDTLRKVRNLEGTDILEANDEELAFRLAGVLNSGASVEEQLAAILGDEGILKEYMTHQVPSMVGIALEETVAELAAKAGAEATKQAAPQTTQAAGTDPEAELPAELKDIIAKVRASGGTVEVIKLGD